MISLVKNYQMQLENLIWEASRALLSSLEEWKLPVHQCRHLRNYMDRMEASMEVKIWMGWIMASHHLQLDIRQTLIILERPRHTPTLEWLALDSSQNQWKLLKRNLTWEDQRMQTNFKIKWINQVQALIEMIIIRFWIHLHMTIKKTEAWVVVLLKPQVSTGKDQLKESCQISSLVHK